MRVTILNRVAPEDSDWEVVEILSRTAALAIERQQALEAQQKLSALVEHSPNFIGVANLEQRPLFLNPAGRELVGLTPEEVPQTTILDYFPEDERERIEREILPAVAAERTLGRRSPFPPFQDGRTHSRDVECFCDS